MRRPLRILTADRAGTSTVELAIIFPVLVLLTFVAADIAMAFKMKIKFQRSAERTAQMATAGGLNGASYDTANLQADAASAAGVATSNVAIAKTLLCNDVVQPPTTPETLCIAGEQMKRYVAITITGNYMPMFGKLLPGSVWASTQGVPLTGSASVRLQ